MPSIPHALERQDRGYPGALGRSVEVVTEEDWVSQFDAAERLEVGVGRIGLLITNRRLTPVHDNRGRAGVERRSVDREADRRRGAGAARRALLLLGDIGRALAASL
ncbi:MAG: hypothetical protein ACRD03_06670 [Acidimicrobiales bacterium]